MAEKKNHKNMSYLLKKPEVEAWRTLMHAYNQIYRHLEKELHKVDCSIPRFQIFFYLYFQGPLSATDLAKLLQVTRGNISTFLRRLEQDQLIYVSKASGRGGKQEIDLSEQGVAVFESHFPNHIKEVTAIMPRLSEKSLKDLAKINL